jgi:hypothetical protein
MGFIGSICTALPVDTLELRGEFPAIYWIIAIHEIVAQVEIETKR